MELSLHLTPSNEDFGIHFFKESGAQHVITSTHSADI